MSGINRSSNYRCASPKSSATRGNSQASKPMTPGAIKRENQRKAEAERIKGENIKLGIKLIAKRGGINVPSPSRNCDTNRVRADTAAFGTFGDKHGVSRTKNVQIIANTYMIAPPLVPTQQVRIVHTSQGCQLEKSVSKKPEVKLLWPPSTQSTAPLPPAVPAPSVSAQSKAPPPHRLRRLHPHRLSRRLHPHWLLHPHRLRRRLQWPNPPPRESSTPPATVTGAANDVPAPQSKKGGVGATYLANLKKSSGAAKPILTGATTPFSELRGKFIPKNVEPVGTSKVGGPPGDSNVDFYKSGAGTPVVESSTPPLAVILARGDSNVDFSQSGAGTPVVQSQLQSSPPPAAVEEKAASKLRVIGAKDDFYIGMSKKPNVSDESRAKDSNGFSSINLQPPTPTPTPPLPTPPELMVVPPPPPTLNSPVPIPPTSAAAPTPPPADEYLPEATQKLVLSIMNSLAQMGPIDIKPEIEAAVITLAKTIADIKDMVKLDLGFPVDTVDKWVKKAMDKFSMVFPGGLSPEGRAQLNLALNSI